jgi:4-oxalocrotonate tautomerase
MSRNPAGSLIAPSISMVYGYRAMNSRESIKVMVKPWRRSNAMQNVIVKMYAGGRKRRRRFRQRNHSRAVTGVWRRSRFGQHLEDVAPKDLVEKVYRPDIADKLGQLYEKPGYNPL